MFHTSGRCLVRDVVNREQRICDMCCSWWSPREYMVALVSTWLDDAADWWRSCGLNGMNERFVVYIWCSTGSAVAFSWLFVFGWAQRAVRFVRHPILSFDATRARSLQQIHRAICMLARKRSLMCHAALFTGWMRAWLEARDAQCCKVRVAAFIWGPFIISGGGRFGVYTHNPQWMTNTHTNTARHLVYALQCCALLSRN